MEGNNRTGTTAEIAEPAKNVAEIYLVPHLKNKIKLPESFLLLPVRVASNGQKKVIPLIYKNHQPGSDGYGTESGKITLKNTWIQEAPSIRAASTRLLGISLKNWVNKNMASPLAAPGKIRAE